MKQIKKLGRNLKKNSPLNQSNNGNKSASRSTDSPSKHPSDLLSSSLAENRQRLTTDLGDNADINIRDFNLGAGVTPALLCYFEGIAETAGINLNILNALINYAPASQADQLAISLQPDSPLMAFLKSNVLAFGNVKSTSNYSQLMGALLQGKSVLLVEGHNTSLIFDTETEIGRQVDLPQTEISVLGPQEAFTESIRVNASLIRARLRTKDLKLISTHSGDRADTRIIIAYIEGLAGPEIIQELKNRISKIHIDGILDSNVIVELTRDAPISLFPTTISTERSDTVAGALLEGRVAVLVDRSPLALIMPACFFDFLMSAEDYYTNPFIASFLRLLRAVGLNIALLLPSLYIALVSFHQEMIPTPLLISVAIQRENVPYPALIEALLMEITFEVLREAGLRLPRPVGQAISIVGALVIGEAAVNAGLVSSAMVIVVSLTAISTFVIPRYSMGLAIRTLRFPIMFLSATFGLYGTIIGYIFFLTHLAGLRSYGLPYLYPIAPTRLSALKDSMIRAPWWTMITRPHVFGTKDRQRQKPDAKPVPPKN